MRVNVKDILEGIKNSIFVKEEVEKIANERYEICKTCPKSSINKGQSFFDPGKYFSEIRPDEHCSMCACNLHAKTRSLHTNCPMSYWASVASKQEAAKIAAILDENLNP